MTFQKLKKCPYCGNEVKLMNHGGLYYVDCGRYACDRVLITYYETPEKAITGWNDTHEEDMLEHPMFEDEPEWLYKGDCVYEQMTIEDFMNQNQKPKLKQKGVLGIMDYIAEYRQQCEDDCKGIERCEKCNQMLFDEIEEIVRRELDE